MAHTINLTSWYKWPTPPTYRGSDPLGLTVGLQSVTLNNSVLNPDIPLAQSNDVIQYSATTSGGISVSIDEYGHIATTTAPVAGDSFTYTITRLGSLETYTWS